MRSVFHLRACLGSLVGVTLCLTPAPSQGQTPDSGRVVLEYIAHAAFRIHSPAGSSILIDPYADRVWLGYDFPRDVSADAVFITHPHYDHDGGRRMGRAVPWPEETPVYADPGRYRVGDISITGIRGKHADPYGKEFGQSNTLWLIDVGGIRIAHLGDNGPLTDRNVEELGRVDVLLIPVDGDYHILKADEIEAIREALSPKLLVPMHYRIAALEPGAGPSDLGEIEPWLVDKPNVMRMGGHRLPLDRELLPPAELIVVLDHSPAVRTPR